ncbi:hypothetical protein [Bradyrhizobium vignae]|uniref:Uncharacterized protein n=1 Tax=Bradyrhizobium vignae TaxID=1549949 RepID=A0A2U3PV67_9BRAD|nr:hypothetical protein [Bradyrhizobium vignae]SPP93067.1 conserved membrane protein of unknown function [Bradyrhizobium vignae]
MTYNTWPVGTRGTINRSSIQQVRSRPLPDVNAAFWATRLIATAAGQMAGRALILWMNTGYWGGVVALTTFGLVSAIGMMFARRRLAEIVFWWSIAAITFVGANLAEAVDKSLGIGDLGAILHWGIYLVLSFVIWYRMRGAIAGPVGLSWRGTFFWVTAALAQTVCCALSDWVADPDGPDRRVTMIVLGLSLAATLALYVSKSGRVAVFWSGFIISGFVGALGGQTVLQGIQLILN